MSIVSVRELYREVWNKWDYDTRFKGIDFRLIKEHDAKPIPFQTELYLVDRDYKVTWVPFKYNKEGFIIRRTDKFEMLADENGKPFTRLHDTAFRKPYFTNKKYVVWMGKGQRTTNCNFMGFENALVAINFAYSKYMSKVKLNGISVCSLDIFQETVCYKILKPAFELIADREYNALTQAVESTPPQLAPIVKTVNFPSSQGIDQEIYDHFSKFLSDSIASKTSHTVKWGSRSNCVGTLECLAGEQLLLKTSKKDVPFDFVTMCVKENGFSPLVTRFPKSGAVTSKGYLRDIYPMNILYENVLRRYIGNAKPVIPFRQARGRDFGLPLGRFYDVISCDTKLVKYLARYCEEHDCKFLIPRVHDAMQDDDFAYYIDKFPSGVLHTSLVTVCFTAALCKKFCCYDAVIQGDGFMTSTIVESDMVRQEQSFNGFVFNRTSRSWIYTRGDRLYDFKYIRGCGPVGKMRYVITRWAYQELGYIFIRPKRIACQGHLEFSRTAVLCEECGTYYMYGKHFEDMTDYMRCDLINSLYSDVGHVIKIVLQEKGASHDTRKNGWDSQKTVIAKVGSHTYSGELVFPREGDPN